MPFRKRLGWLASGRISFGKGSDGKVLEWMERDEVKMAGT
jgi:hypothetical protein